MTEIKIGLGATIALPGYNSIRVDYWQSAHVPQDASVAEAREELYNEVDNYLSNLVEQVKKES